MLRVCVRVCVHACDWSGVSAAVQDAERQERERLRQEWVEQQEKLKGELALHLVPISPVSIPFSCVLIPFPGEEIRITYSYWDGSGHRRSVVVSYASPNPLSVGPSLRTPLQRNVRHWDMPFSLR